MYIVIFKSLHQPDKRPLLYKHKENVEKEVAKWNGKSYYKAVVEEIEFEEE